MSDIVPSDLKAILHSKRRASPVYGDGLVAWYCLRKFSHIKGDKRPWQARANVQVFPTEA
jgi:hypothetical protein